MAYSLKEINEAVRSDPKGFVEECDAAYNKKIEKAARQIAENRANSRIVLLSGPSGSGKTTTAKKIEAKLEEMGIHSLQNINPAMPALRSKASPIRFIPNRNKQRPPMRVNTSKISI